MHSYVWHDAFTCVTDVFICVTWCIHMCDMTHWYVWHDAFICVTWLIHMWAMVCVTWRIHMCDMTHLYVCHGNISCRTYYSWCADTRDRESVYLCGSSDFFFQKHWCLTIWTSHVTNMNKSCCTVESVMSHVWISLDESCHTYESVMLRTWMRRVTHMHESCHTYKWVMSHMWMRRDTHMHESCHTYEWVMSYVCPSNASATA